MKPRILFMSFLAVILLLSGSLQAQDNVPDWVWKTPMTKVHALGEYLELPQTDNYENPNKTTRVIETPIGTFLLPPNVRPFPHSATQSEIDATSMRGNRNVMWAAWNSYGPSFYGTGYASTINGGANWQGNNVTFTPNSGDPACWVWPTGSTWAGRFGHSVIQGAGYSVNNGTTWTFAMNFPGASSFDKNFSCVDDVTGSPFFSRAYTVWTNFGGTYANRIVISYSTDGGVTWTSAAPVSPVPTSGHHHQGCDVRVGPGGVVHVVWGNCTTNGQNSTEDYLGYARSTDGGVTWAYVNDFAVDMNGIRSSNLFNGIRANGFPRIDVDKTGGARNGWIFVVAGEKNFAPATDVADVVLMRSTNNGVNWTRTKVNQDVATGRFQYFPSVVVDDAGGLNISYYDQRNTTGFVTEVYMSRSLNGGTTFTDMQVSDHTFTPSPIPGLAGGYQGDYAGIAYGVNKVWPFWMDNSSGTYQCWTEGISLGAPPANDIQVGPFLSLPGQFVINTSYPIKTRVANVGSANQTGVPIRWFINSVLTNTTNINLNAGQVDSVSNNWTPTSPGQYTLTYASGLANDTNRNNDTVRTTVTVLAAPPQYGTVCRNGLNKPILDYQITLDTINTNFGNGCIVTDVNVRIDTVLHTWDADLIFRLYHAGIGQLIINRAGGSGDNFIGTILNDSASTPIGSGVAPFTGQYQPSGPLNVFNATSANGQWVLWIADTAGADQGTLKAWCVVITYANCTGGLQTVEIPNYYALKQNYPNPFNPSTKITYAIPKTGNVVLKIYDVLGKEVSVLVNEVKQPGIYTIDFDGSRLASGVYFYRIDAGDFTSVKKMLLVK